jgi:hypothetical protein
MVSFGGIKSEETEVHIAIPMWTAPEKDSLQWVVEI